MSRWRWSIQRSLAVPADVGAVWRHVGDPEEVSLWWCPPPTVRIQFEPYVGSTYEERYRDATYAYDVFGAVVGYERPYRLAIQRDTSGRFGLMDRVEIVLMPDDHQTSINLTHSFGELTEERRREAYDFFADGWSASLKHLRQRVTDSSGDPLNN